MERYELSDLEPQGAKMPELIQREKEIYCYWLEQYEKVEIGDKVSIQWWEKSIHFGAKGIIIRKNPASITVQCQRIGHRGQHKEPTKRIKRMPMPWSSEFPKMGLFNNSFILEQQ